MAKPQPWEKHINKILGHKDVGVFFSRYKYKKYMDICL